MTTTRSRRGFFAAAMLIALLLAAVTLAACGSGGEATSSPSASPSPIAAIDDTGAVVALPQPAERIVSLAPANTEIAFAVGAGPKMVAGTSYDDYPAEARALPKIGDFSNPSVEKIASFEPDLVLAAGGIQQSLRSKLEKLGMQVYVVDPKSYADVIKGVEQIGLLAGTSVEAQKVSQAMAFARDDVAAMAASLDKPTVFLEIYNEPLMTAGKGTFINDMITIAGGVNLGATAGEGFPNFSTEVLFKSDPDVYIADSGSMSKPGAIAKRSGFRELTAVKEGRVFVIDDNLIARPGPRLADGLRELVAMIHPEAGSPAP